MLLGQIAEPPPPDRGVHETDPAKREADYIQLQKDVLDRGAFAIMFQSISQRADRSNVKGFVQGSSADVTYYNLTTK